MFSTFFTSKRKPTSNKSSNDNNYKISHTLLDILLAELDINFFSKTESNELRMKEVKKVDKAKETGVLSDDLQQIALNQLAYSKLMQKKLQKTKLGKKKGKSILLHSWVAGIDPLISAC